MKNQRFSTPFLAIITCILWASSFVPTKIGLENFPPILEIVGYRPLTYAGMTFLLAGIILIPWANHKHEYWQQVKNNIRIIFKIGFFSTTLLYGAYYSGQNLADASILALIVGCQPLFVFLLAALIVKNEKITLPKAISLIAAIIGMVVVSYPSFSNIGTIGLSGALGIILILIDCISAAYGNILIYEVNFEKTDIRVLNSAEMIAGGAMLLLLSLVLGFVLPPIPPAPEPQTSKFLVGLGAMVFINFTSMILWFKCLARENTKVSDLNMWKFIIPVVGSLQSWLLLKNDNPTISSVSGLVIITLALVMFYFVSEPKKNRTM